MRSRANRTSIPYAHLSLAYMGATVPVQADHGMVRRSGAESPGIGDMRPWGAVSASRCASAPPDESAFGLESRVSRGVLPGFRLHPVAAQKRLEVLSGIENASFVGFPRQDIQTCQRSSANNRKSTTFLTEDQPRLATFGGKVWDSVGGGSKRRSLDTSKASAILARMPMLATLSPRAIREMVFPDSPVIRHKSI